MWEISHEMERNLVHAGEIIKVRYPVHAGVRREGNKSFD